MQRQVVGIEEGLGIGEKEGGGGRSSAALIEKWEGYGLDGCRGSIMRWLQDAGIVISYVRSRQW